MRRRRHLDEDALTRRRPSARTSRRGRWIGGALLLVPLSGVGCEPGVDDSAAFLEVDSIIDAWVADDRITGATLVVVDGGRTAHEHASGVLQRHAYDTGQYPSADAVSPRGLTTLATTTPVTVESFFDLASVTKVLATTMAVMILVDRGRLDLDAPVSSILPDYRGVGRDEITTRQLLTHMSGLPQWWPVYYHANEREAAWTWLRSQAPRWPVGEERHYSDLGFMTLGRIVEYVTGERLDRFLARELYEPLGVNAHFRPDGLSPPGFDAVAATSHGNPFERRMVHDADFGYAIDLAPDAWDEWRAYTLVGEVNDGNAWHAFGGVAGHAGLFGSARDAAALVQLMLDGGSANGTELIRRTTVETFRAQQITGQALGWQLPDYAPRGSFGHTGFTGTFVLGVPDRDRVIVLLTNRQNPGVDEATQYTDVGPLQRAITSALTTQPSGG